MQMFLDEGPGDRGPTLLVLRNDRSPVLEIPPTGPLSSRFTLPEAAEELVRRGTVLNEVAEALDKAKLSKPARAAVESCLVGLGWEEPE